MAEIFQFPKPPRADAEEKLVSNVRQEPKEWKGDISRAVVGLGRGLMYRLRENNGAFAQEERARIVDALKANPSHDNEVREALNSGLGDTEFRVALVSVLHYRRDVRNKEVLMGILRNFEQPLLIRRAACEALIDCTGERHDWILFNEEEWLGGLEPMSEEE